MDFDEKFQYKTKPKFKSNDTETEMDQKSQIEESYENSSDNEIVEFKSKVT